MIIRLEETDLKPLIDAAIPISGLFILALGIAVYFLWRSMNKQVKRIDASLPSGRDEQRQAEDAEAQSEAVARGEQGGPAVP